jgi:NitT/TauT family transport system ATP-binding protein
MLDVVHLKKRYGEGAGSVEAVGDLTFTVREKEFVCLVGPSGAGKTTLLKCISGLISPTSGHVSLAGRTIDGPPEEMALVFQDYSRSLLPWMSVRDNVLFPLRRKRLDKTTREGLVMEALEVVDLSGFAQHYPWQLSGGMQQRVAIARALAYQPRILLMDEPFASVDAQTRADLEDTVLRVQRDYGVTVLFVTHDVDEAVFLGDRVIVLTPRPSRVAEALTIDLPRPRDQLLTRELPEFVRLRAHVYGSIKGRKHSHVPDSSS